MKKPLFNLKGRVWLYPGTKASWYFVSLTKKASKEIRDGYMFIGKRGFGSVPVRVTIGLTNWNTSIFPDSKRGVFILPLKAEVRKKENIKKNSAIDYLIEVRI